MSLEINECDFCGDEFAYPPDPELQELDYCVCRGCEDVAREQMYESGELSDDMDNMDPFNDEMNL